MNAIPDRLRRAAATLLALTSLGAGFQVAAAEQPAAPGQAPQQYIPAVLKLHEFDFFYHSSLVNLSCIALKGRISSILRVLGARDDVNVDVTGCDVLVQDEPADVWHSQTDRTQNPTDRWRTSSSSRLARRSATNRAQSAHIRLRMMMPVEVTPEVLAELEKDKSRRELVSRVLKNPAPGLNDPIVFPAQRQLITLSRRTIDVEPEECELLEQMATSVFPRLGIRVAHRGPNCGRDEISRILPQVTVEALMPVMPAGPQLLPPEEPPAATAPAPAESAPAAPVPGEPAAAETKSTEPAPAPKPE